MILEESRDLSFLSGVVKYIDTNDFDVELDKVIIPNLLDCNNYSNTNLRFYYNIETNEFTNYMSLGVTFLRTVIQIDNLNATTFKKALVESLENYYDLQLNATDKTINGFINNGMLTYLDATDKFSFVTLSKLDLYNPLIIEELVKYNESIININHFEHLNNIYMSGFPKNESLSIKVKDYNNLLNNDDALKVFSSLVDCERLLESFKKYFVKDFYKNGNKSNLNAYITMVKLFIKLSYISNNLDYIDWYIENYQVNLLELNKQEQDLFRFVLNCNDYIYDNYYAITNKLKINKKIGGAFNVYKFKNIIAATNSNKMELPDSTIEFNVFIFNDFYYDLCELYNNKDKYNYFSVINEVSLPDIKSFIPIERNINYNHNILKLEKIT